MFFIPFYWAAIQFLPFILPALPVEAKRRSRYRGPVDSENCTGVKCKAYFSGARLKFDPQNTQCMYACPNKVVHRGG